VFVETGYTGKYYKCTSTRFCCKDGVSADVYLNTMKHTVIAVVIGFGLMGLFLCAPQTARAATNLLPNYGFETADPANSGRPQGWTSGRWGTNTTTFTYPAPGVSGHGAKITMSARTTGDAKWTTGPINIVGGKVYEYTDSYTSDVTTHVTLELTLSDGTVQYPDLGAPAPATWGTAKYRFTAPSNARTVRVFHLINQAGTLTIDNASLTEIESTPPPPTDPDNIINNPSLESVDSAGLPVGWLKGRWGTNTTNFIYPTAPQHGSKAARVEMTAWTSGDAKWYFQNVSVTPGGVYEFSSYSKSSRTTFVTVQFKKSDGSVSYLDLDSRPASGSWTKFTERFTVPMGVTSLTIFHVIKGVGTLDIDNYSLTRTTVDPVSFDKGYVSLNFDDGWLSVYQNAIPILNAAGFKSDQYITTDYLTDNYPGYMKPQHVLALQQQGHVIGAHTRSHPNLTTLTTTQARAEIAGSRQDLLDLGATPVNTFAYPLGAYNTTIQALVREAGFTAGRSSNGGYNDKQTDKYALRRISMENTTTFAQVKGHIDAALAEKKWVILLFHEVNTSGHRYAISPALLQQIVDYIKSKNMTPITVEQGIQKMSQ
jgi:peptidoglycan/xylan/chitin deacetylase (PgdA/CDA1 family)